MINREVGPFGKDEGYNGAGLTMGIPEAVKPRLRMIGDMPQLLAANLAAMNTRLSKAWRVSC